MDEALGRLETQMAVLGRRIENASRRSTTYDRMDRAAYLIARTLEERGSAGVNELARTLALDGSTVTRQVASMEARQFVHRKQHPEDGRAWVINLTALGRKEMEAISAGRRARFAEFLHDWHEGDVDELGRLLARFNAALAVDARRDASAPAPTESTALSSDSAAPEPRHAGRRRTEHRQSVLPPPRRSR